VEVCTPVSETGRAGALPAAAANLIHADFNKEQTPHPNEECRVQNAELRNRTKINAENFV
jgi:hypothetical protein